MALENGYSQSAAALERAYAPTYDITLDLPEVTTPVIAINPQQVSMAEELKQRLLLAGIKKVDNSNDNLQLEGQQQSFGLAKTVTEEKTIFASQPSTANITEVAPSNTVRPIPKMALSKLVEFPGDESHLREQLHDPSVALNGKDMYGLTALMKFAAWNKVNLLDILLPHLTTEEINTYGGRSKLPLLHYCVDMDASTALERLLQDGRVDVNARDEYGRTWREHAVYSGKSGLLGDSAI